MIRAETASDQQAIWEVHAAAFPTQAEADLVDRLRKKAKPFLSFVAENDTRVIGHVVLSPVTIDTSTATGSLMGLAPLAVLPECQGQGLGSALVARALEECAHKSVDAVVLLGSPEYYHRFGFKPAAGFGLKCVYDAPVDAFMVHLLNEVVSVKVAGTVHYHAAFDAL